MSFDFVRTWQRPFEKLCVKISPKQGKSKANSNGGETAGDPMSRRDAHAEEQRRIEIWNYQYDFGDTADTEEKELERLRRSRYASGHANVVGHQERTAEPTSMHRHLLFFDLSFLSSDSTTPAVSTSWFICGRSPLQLRSRLSKALAFIRSFSVPFLYQKRKAPPCLEDPFVTGEPQTPHSTTSFLKRTTRTPPPPYRNLPTSETSRAGSQEDPNGGIDMKYAQQGLSLLQASFRELNQNPTFARRLYTTALIYLLQSLADLSELEALNLKSALPYSIIPSEAGHGQPQAHCEKENINNENAPTPSFLHRILSTTIFTFVLLAKFLLPYACYFFSTLAYCDREYNIHQRLFNSSSTVLRRIWDMLIRAVDPVWLSWCMAEVTGGLSEGWRMGMGTPNKERVE
ncbi:MAG: hypothetical protein Q9181_004683 [Wetmoreana brouardii]